MVRQRTGNFIADHADCASRTVPRTGPWLTIFPRSRRSGSCSSNSQAHAASCGPSSSTRGGTTSRMRGLRRGIQAHLQLEEMNKRFSRQYKQIKLLQGHPGLLRPAAGEELKILEPLPRCRPRSSPPRTPIRSPARLRKVRANLREGIRLMAAAGYELRDQKQVHVRTGEGLSVEISRDQRSVGSGRSACSTSLPLLDWVSTPRAKCRRCPIWKSIT